MTAYRRMSVPLTDGELTVGVWGSGSRAVLAVHGVTSSHQAWRLVAERLPEDTLLIAPDLRGRGDAARCPARTGWHGTPTTVRPFWTPSDVPTRWSPGTRWGASSLWCSPTAIRNGCSG